MTKLSILLIILSFFLQANRVKPKIMHAQDNQRDYHDNYAHSSNHHDKKEEILCSTSEATGQITFMITLQSTTEITSEGHGRNSARLSYIENNRIEITEDIAKGEGEHLETLLKMIKPNFSKKSLEAIQENFDELIYLSHNDFLNKLESLL
jgi:hypothetical protein